MASERTPTDLTDAIRVRCDRSPTALAKGGAFRNHPVAGFYGGELVTQHSLAVRILEATSLRLRRTPRRRRARVRPLPPGSDRFADSDADGDARRFAVRVAHRLRRLAPC